MAFLAKTLLITAMTSNIFSPVSLYKKIETLAERQQKAKRSGNPSESSHPLNGADIVKCRYGRIVGLFSRVTGRRYREGPS